jgi:hypothetical protein
MMILLNYIVLFSMGHAVAQLGATSRKAAGSVPDDITEIFH